MSFKIGFEVMVHLSTPSVSSSEKQKGSQQSIKHCSALDAREGSGDLAKVSTGIFFVITLSQVSELRRTVQKQEQTSVISDITQTSTYPN